MAPRDSRDGRDDDPWKRLRDREEREEENAELARSTTRKTDSSLSAGREAPESLVSLFDRIVPLIEQVNQLYSLYLAGVEKLPPIEKRKQLEQWMSQLMQAPKPTTAAQFRAQSVQSSYATARDRWDRLMREHETGRKR